MAKEIISDRGGSRHSIKLEPLLEVKGLTKHFPIMRGIIFSKQVGAVQAVDNISFSIRRGETLGLVGESGCGKSTTGRLILRLIEPTHGEVKFEGRDVLGLDRHEMRKIRSDMQIVFQNPYASLDPRMNIHDIVAEPLRVHNVASGKPLTARVRELLDLVGLNPSYAERYPHEFSGGQRQRIGIARALALKPKFVIADEPVSALDVSIQAQVLNLLADLQRDFGLTYLFIAHNLSTVEHVSDRVAVMYLGKMVELTDSEKLYRDPKHPYTRALMSAIPVPDPTYKSHRMILEGDVPSPVNPPSGCRFHTRCQSREEVRKRDGQDTCSMLDPFFGDTGEEHFVACHLYATSTPGAQGSQTPAFRV